MQACKVCRQRAASIYTWPVRTCHASRSPGHARRECGLWEVPRRRHVGTPALRKLYWLYQADAWISGHTPPSIHHPDRARRRDLVATAARGEVATRRPHHSLALGHPSRQSKQWRSRQAAAAGGRPRLGKGQPRAGVRRERPRWRLLRARGAGGRPLFPNPMARDQCSADASLLAGGPSAFCREEKPLALRCAEGPEKLKVVSKGLFHT